MKEGSFVNIQRTEPCPDAYAKKKKNKKKKKKKKIEINKREKITKSRNLIKMTTMQFANG